MHAQHGALWDKLTQPELYGCGPQWTQSGRRQEQEGCKGLDTGSTRGRLERHVEILFRGIFVFLPGWRVDMPRLWIRNVIEA